MRTLTDTFKVSLFCVALCAAALPGKAQTYDVTNANSSGAGSLWDAITQANSGSANIIDIQGGLGPISMTAQMVVNANVTINGNGNTIDMNNSDRAFFLAGGTININDLTIQNGNASGGSGTDGGGGGAGLGGAIFVANGTSITNQITLPTNVTLSNVQLSGNGASGGAGSEVITSGAGGGGGGMGGNGGAAYNSDFYSGGGGGGGFGNGAAGGDANTGGTGDGGTGAFYPGFTSGAFSAGNGGPDTFGSTGGYGGSNGGGGGGADAGTNAAGGGGGGVGGQSSADNDDNGGNGGFGGGGGGGAYDAGVGGFGGGGGANGLGFDGKSGGFGGGGGLGGTSGTGGFGAGNGGEEDGLAGGGGGLGAGGAIFVMAGSTLNLIDSGFAGNSVAGGTGAYGGSAVGADLFLGANTTITVSGSNSQIMNALGGAGNLSDPNIATHANDANAQGGLTKQGTGELILIGNNYYTGTTIINQGMLTFGNNALEQGTSTVIVGQNDGDNALLEFGNGATLNLGGFTGLTDLPVMLGEFAGSTGAINIGGGAGSSGAYLGLREITGGVGGGTLNFLQELDAAGATNNYPFFTTITGNVAVYQGGAGITTLDPLYGANTYTGGTIVASGTLVAANAGALGSGEVTVSGGALVVNGGTAIANTVTMNEGSYAVQVLEDGDYAGMADATSDFGNGRSTEASILSGTSSAGTTLETSFAESTGALNDEIRLSDAYSFAGTGGDIFVLELSMTEVGSNSILGWLNDETNLWVNATTGNTGNNASGGELGFAGTFANFQLTYGYDLTQYVGAYGVDATGDSVWAVLNHNSDFAVLAVPEPATTSLLLGAAALAMIWKMRRAKSHRKNHESANRHL